jgi:hypothetical protein
MVFFNFYDYLKNPIAEFCAKQNSANILTLEDLYPYLDKLPYTQKVLNIDRKASIGNEFRLYLASISDDFLYLDLDCFIPKNVLSDIESIKNCVAYQKPKTIETGTFFHSGKDCRFIEYYVNKYKELAEKNDLRKINIFVNFPFEMHDNFSGDMQLYKVDKNVRHFYLDTLIKFHNFYPDIDKIYYTYNNKSVENVKNIWMFNTRFDTYARTFSFYNIFWHYDTMHCPFIDKDTLEELFKAQMNYLYQKEMQFIEV